MPIVDISAKFEPETLKAYKRNEATMHLSLKNPDESKTFWCECDIKVNPPLSLAYDRELNAGHARVGILKPNGNAVKPIKIYTRPNNFPDDYALNITAYVYDEDGAIAERIEHNTSIKCDG